MTLEEIYPEIKKSIVAFVPSHFPKEDPASGHRFPPILGTGFVARQDGIIITNRHVAESFADVWRSPGSGPDDWGVSAMFLYPAEKGIIDVRIPVSGIINIGSGSRPYGPKTPDLAMVRIMARDLKAMAIPENRRLKEGTEVATAGYPMGRRALDGPMGIHQITPTLQKGIISAILPFPSERPYSFSVNIMSNSGGSGSPVFFTDTGEIAGVLFSVLSDVGFTKGNDEYLIPTSISYAVPFHYIRSALSGIEEIGLPETGGARSMEKIICESSPGKTYRDGVCYHEFEEN